MAFLDDVTYKATDMLMTPQEAVDYSPSDDHSYPRQRKSHIVLCEEKIFSACFGMDFYRTLLADKIEYKIDVSGDEQFSLFQKNTNYNTGDFVKYKQRIYRVDSDTDGSQTPNNEDFFSIAPKFDKAEHQFIWERYLRQILAFSINNSTLMYRIVQDGARGIQNLSEKDGGKVSVQDARSLSTEYDRDVSRLVDSMNKFILENKEYYPDHKLVKESECGKNDCQKTPLNKNFGFNVHNYE